MPNTSTENATAMRTGIFDPGCMSAEEAAACDACFEGERDRFNDEDIAHSDLDLQARAPRKSAPVQYPTSKPGRYSKDRRYVPAPKKSDKASVRSTGGKGAKHKKCERGLGL